MKKRSYQSPIRQRHADDTRVRIAAAARKLLEEHGYAGMTMPAVAKKAGVAVATVYAVFGSKTGILSEILDAARFDESYQNLVHEAMHTSDPRERLRFPARIARRIYESEHSVLDLLRGAGTVAPTLARSEAERECTRYDAQANMIQFLVRSRTLRPDPQHARDILWSLTSRDLYRLLVRERGWTAQQYEDWLADTLVEALVRPAVVRPAAVRPAAVRPDVHSDLRPDPPRKR
jgi:AcrR family transcriptional regulator